MPKRLLVLALLFATPVFARTHKYRLEVPCTQAWKAVRNVLMESGKYGVLYMNDKDMNASYNIGGNLSHKRTNSVQLGPAGVECRMRIQTAYSGLIHDDSKAFDKRVKKALRKIAIQNAGNPSSPPTLTPTEPAAPASAPGALPAAAPVQAQATEPQAAPAPQAATLLTIMSDPGGADIELDGNFVGDTPSAVSVKPGKHTLKVSITGYTPWERTINTSGGTVTISAKLRLAVGPKP